MHISPDSWIERRIFTQFCKALHRRYRAFNSIGEEARYAEVGEVLRSVTAIREIEEDSIPSICNSLWMALVEKHSRHDNGPVMDSDNLEIPILVLGEYGSRPGRLVFQFTWNEHEVQVEAVQNSHNGVSVFVQIAHDEDGQYGAVYTDSPWFSNNNVTYVREHFYRCLLEDLTDWNASGEPVE